MLQFVRRNHIVGSAGVLSGGRMDTTAYPSSLLADPILGSHCWLSLKRCSQGREGRYIVVGGVPPQYIPPYLSWLPFSLFLDMRRFAHGTSE